MDSFNKFKRRIKRNILIKIIIASVSAGLFCVGAILLACKLSDTNLLFSLIGIAGFALGGGIAFFILKTNDKKIAEILDNTFGLKEKTQTMVEYAENSDDMSLLQRKDATDRLEEHSVKELSFRFLWVYVAVALVALALFITALALPRAEENEVVIPPREVTEWEWQALDELILYVENSEADETIMKPRTLEALNSLKNLLKNGVSEESLKTFVNVTVTEIGNAFVDANSSDEIADEQKAVNAEVRSYTVRRLYEIFDMTVPSEGQNEDKKDDNGMKEDDEGKDGSGGSGDVILGANEKFFDPVKGYVSYNEVIGDYYEEVKKAFDDGVISKEEWYDFLNTYFEYLYGVEKDN